MSQLNEEDKFYFSININHINAEIIINGSANGLPNDIRIGARYGNSNTLVGFCKGADGNLKSIMHPSYNSKSVLTLVNDSVNQINASNNVVENDTILLKCDSLPLNIQRALQQSYNNLNIKLPWQLAVLLATVF